MSKAYVSSLEYKDSRVEPHNELKKYLKKFDYHRSNTSADLQFVYFENMVSKIKI